MSGITVKLATGIFGVFFLVVAGVKFLLTCRNKRRNLGDEDLSRTGKHEIHLGSPYQLDDDKGNLNATLETPCADLSPPAASKYKWR